MIRVLARMMPDKAIAALLNRAGKRTDGTMAGRKRGSAPSATNVVSRAIATANVPSGGQLTLQEAAARLEVSPMSVLRLIRAGTLPAEQLCKDAPWVTRADVEKPEVARAANAKRKRPLPHNSDQKLFAF